MDLKGNAASELAGRIIECTFDQPTQTWLFLRERHDKDMPNAMHVFDKVHRSILDNITQEFLLDYIDQAVKEKVYDKDRALPAAQTAKK